MYVNIFQGVGPSLLYERCRKRHNIYVNIFSRGWSLYFQT